MGFPLDGITPSTGNIRVALIPIDFSDAIGTTQELVNAQIQIDLFNQWVTSQSRSALSVEWTMPDEWLRTSTPSQDYGFSPELAEAAMSQGPGEYVARVTNFGTEGRTGRKDCHAHVESLAASVNATRPKGPKSTDA